VAGGATVTWAALASDGKTLGYAVADSLFVRDAAGRARKLAHFLEPSLCAWSPDGAAIACASGNARYATAGVNFGNLSPSWIVVCRVKDGALSEVTGRLSMNHSPAWSRDGRWLYFVSDRDGVRDIYLQKLTRDLQADGPPVRGTTGLSVQSLSASPDGNRLAYVVFLGTGNVWSLPRPSLASEPVSAAIATPVTAGTQTIENVRVSRDERWLLYDSDLGGKADVFRMALPSGEPERLTTDPADDFSPELSPDGREVVFHSWRAGSRDIYVMPLDGGPVKRLTDTPAQEWQPAWSPDGSAVVFGESSPTGALWIVRRDRNGVWGRPVKRLDSGGQWSAWSPDGRLIAFATDPFLVRGDLAVVPVDSGEVRTLVDAKVPGHPPVEQVQFSEDGRTIYFKSHDARGNASIWSVPTAGGPPRLHVKFDDPARPSYRTAWALGRTRIYFTIEDRQSDVWVVEVGRTD
jgi:TolB protein